MKSNSKCFVNNTNQKVNVTVYIANLISGTFKVNETRTVEILAGKSKDIEYGNVQNSFLIGIKITSNLNGAIISSSQRTDDAESEFCSVLNCSHIFEIQCVSTLKIEMLA